MKVLAIYRHYWPDTTPYARLLRMILERLVEDGHAVSVVAGQPSYNDTAEQRSPWRETLGGVDVMRVALLPERKRWRLARLLNAQLFLLRAIVHATLFKRYDLLVANAHPPVLIGMALRTIAWLTGAKYVLHLQDIHPESACTVGSLQPGPATRLARRIDAASCARAACNVTLSSDMERSLQARDVAPAPVRLINNCQQPTYAEEAAAELPELWAPDCTRVLFAGNLGKFQALDALGAATRLVTRRDELGLAFMGVGAAKEAVQQAADPAVVRFVDRQPLPVAHAAMRVADYGVVSLAPGVIRYAYPSKTMAYLAAGLPLLLVVERDSELADLVVENQLGVVARAATPEAIAEALDEAVLRRHEWTPARRASIARFAEAQFGAAKMLDAWSELVHDLGDKTASRRPAPPHTRAAA